MDDKGRAMAYSNHNNIIIMTAFARLVMTKHQAAALLNSGSFSIRLFSAIIMMLSKVEPKTQHKRALDSESDHFSFSLDLDLIINSFARGTHKRLKHILLNQNTFKLKSLISLTTFISSSLISSDQRIFKLRSFTSFILINIIRKQIKVVFLKARSDRRIFERDFPRYNKVLNKAFRQFKRTPLNKDYVSIYLSDSIVILDNSTFESSPESIDDDDLFGIIVQLIEFDSLTSTQSLRVSNNISKSQL